MEPVRIDRVYAQNPNFFKGRPLLASDFEKVLRNLMGAIDPANLVAPPMENYIPALPSQISRFLPTIRVPYGYNGVGGGTNEYDYLNTVSFNFSILPNFFAGQAPRPTDTHPYFLFSLKGTYGSTTTVFLTMYLSQSDEPSPLRWVVTPTSEPVPEFYQQVTNKYEIPLIPRWDEQQIPILQYVPPAQEFEYSKSGYVRFRRNIPFDTDYGKKHTPVTKVRAIRIVKGSVKAIFSIPPSMPSPPNGLPENTDAALRSLQQKISDSKKVFCQYIDEPSTQGTWVGAITPPEPTEYELTGNRPVTPDQPSDIEKGAIYGDVLNVVIFEDPYPFSDKFWSNFTFLEGTTRCFDANTPHVRQDAPPRITRVYSGGGPESPWGRLHYPDVRSSAPRVDSFGSDSHFCTGSYGSESSPAHFYETNYNVSLDDVLTQFGKETLERFRERHKHFIRNRTLFFYVPKDRPETIYGEQYTPEFDWHEPEDFDHGEFFHLTLRDFMPDPNEVVPPFQEPSEFIFLREESYSTVDYFIGPGLALYATNSAELRSWRMGMRANRVRHRTQITIRLFADEESTSPYRHLNGGTSTTDWENVATEGVDVSKNQSQVTENLIQQLIAQYGDGLNWAYGGRLTMNELENLDETLLAKFFEQ